jgi:ligand-binding SRPBCC domain-containing protein
MPVIHLTTFIAAPIERVFDLSRSIDLHKHSMTKYKEEPVGSIINGLVKQGDEITCRAHHLFKTRILKTRITSFDRPNSFTDEQVSGDFALMKNQHFFKPVDNGTIMIDIFEFQSPFGFAGSVLNKLYLTKYMRVLLEQRNKQIKEVAESNRWKNYISN